DGFLPAGLRTVAVDQLFDDVFTAGVAHSPVLCVDLFERLGHKLPDGDLLLVVYQAVVLDNNAFNLRAAQDRGGVEQRLKLVQALDHALVQDRDAFEPDPFSLTALLCRRQIVLQTDHHVIDNQVLFRYTPVWQHIVTWSLEILAPVDPT